MSENTKAADAAAIEIDGMNRSAFILKGALVAGAVYGATSVSSFVRQALAADGDVGILNFALTLEYLEADFYRKAQTLKLSAGSRAAAKLIGAHEVEHVAALKATIGKLGGTAVKMPTFRFPISNDKSFLALAQTLEDTGVSAYNGAGPAIKSKEILAAAGSIVQVEARHAALIRTLNGVTPAPAAFDRALSKSQVLPKVKPLIKA